MTEHREPCQSFNDVLLAAAVLDFSSYDNRDYLQSRRERITL